MAPASAADAQLQVEAGVHEQAAGQQSKAASTPQVFGLGMLANKDEVLC